jgi:drug/metabolite transporter (DMT)-like permease
MIKFITYKLFQQKLTLALFAALLSSTLIGLSPIFVRISEVGPTATALYRFFFALPFIWGWMIYDNCSYPHVNSHPSRLSDYIFLLLGGLFLGCDIALWHWSLVKTSVVNASVLNNLTSIFVMFVAYFFLNERLRLSSIISIILAILGSCILVGENFTVAPESFIGDLLALISAVFYAAYILVIKRLRYTFRTPTILAWGALSSLYFFAYLCYFSGESLFPQTGYGWLSLIGLALLVHICGQGLMAYSIGHLSATFSGLILLIGPVTSAALAWVLFGEALSFLQMVGAAIVLAGITLARKSQ